VGPGEFLNINVFTALFTLLNTVVLFLVLKKFLFKPVMKMIADRQQEIDDMYAAADQDKQQASQLRGEYEEKLAIAKAAGVSRISVNPQTMNEKTLERIGRKHTTEDTVKAFELARKAGFKNINMDLIAGLPGESVEDFMHTLDIIEKLSPDSLTVHTLSIKRASELRYDDNEKASLRADVTGIMTEKASQLARKLGMQPFYMYRQKNQLGNHENVCYCRPGCESPYNIHIMEEDQTIIACGCGAVSKFVSAEGNIVRSFNMKGVPEYLERYDVMMSRKKECLETI
jgi:oxygen-independent coproporphyrinogen-3 oxidase